jgi:hypothetical protein
LEIKPTLDTEEAAGRTMKAIGYEKVEAKEDLTTVGTESTEKKGPGLSDEQREWLNRVFIPNFRAELMRTLELKGLLVDSSRRNGRGAKGKGQMKAGVGRGDTEGVRKDEGGRMKDERGTALSEASYVDRAFSLDKASEDGQVPGDVDKSASDGLDVDNSLREVGEADERVIEMEDGPSSPRLQPMDGPMDRRMDREMDGRMDRTMDRRMDGGMDGRMDRTTERTMEELAAENRRLRSIVAAARVDGELVSAAAAQHAISPGQVAHLLRERIRLDGNLEPMVVDRNGDRAYDGYGRPVAVADAVRAFLEGNPHLVRPSTQLAGGGSGGTDATAMGRRIEAVTGGDLIEEALREGL